MTLRRRQRPVQDRLFRRGLKAVARARNASAAGSTIVSISASDTASDTASAFIKSERLKPLLWRDAADETKASYLHEALGTLGDVFTINVNLRDDVIADAYESENFLQHLRERVALHLKRALGRKPSFWFLIEEEETFDVHTQTHKPHIHGELAISAAEAKVARKALRRAAGEWPMPARKYQVKTRRSPDFYWPS